MPNQLFMQRPNGRCRARAARGAALPLALLLACSLTACAGKSAVDQTAAGSYRYVGTTKRAQLTPISQRKPAGAVSGTLIGGGQLALSSYLGKVVVINFWASWCGPCVAESPQLEGVYERQKVKGVQFVGIDVKDEKQAAQAFIKDAGVTYPIIFDQPGRSALQLGAVNIQGLPVTALLDRQGRVAAVYTGGLLAPDIEPVVLQLAAEK
jgi:thiol-disulfide isomerase/thioredoxin